jgi:hypothetical protein
MNLCFGGNIIRCKISKTIKYTKRAINDFLNRNDVKSGNRIGIKPKQALTAGFENKA